MQIVGVQFESLAIAHSRRPPKRCVQQLLIEIGLLVLEADGDRFGASPRNFITLGK